MQKIVRICTTFSHCSLNSSQKSCFISSRSAPFWSCFRINLLTEAANTQAGASHYQYTGVGGGSDSYAGHREISRESAAQRRGPDVIHSSFISICGDFLTSFIPLWNSPRGPPTPIWLFTPPTSWRSVEVMSEWKSEMKQVWGKSWIIDATLL